MMTGKISKHFRQGMLLQTTCRYLRSKSKFDRIQEALIKKYNGGFFEVPPSETAYSEESAESYVEVREQDQSWTLESVAVAGFLEQLPGGTKVLDVPFGTGRFAPLYASRQLNVTGLEKSNSMIAVARRASGRVMEGVELVQGDASKLPFDDSSFDLIVSFRFLPHIVNFGTAKRILGEFQRVSRKYLIVQLGERQMGDYRRRLPLDHEKMGTWLYPNEIKEFLGSYGFKVINKSDRLHNGVTLNRRYFRNDGGWFAYLCEKI